MSNIRDLIYNEEEFNLLRMYIDTIKKAFEKYKGENLEFIGAKLGITSRSIYRLCDQFNIRYLVDENKKYRSSFVKSK